jgi:hypothetical protein
MSIEQNENGTLVSASLIRWSGLALLVAGLLSAGVVPFHPSDADPGGVLSPLWLPIHLLFALAFVLSLFGLVGLHLRQADKAGVLGLVGFVLTFAASAVLVGVLIILEAYILPAIAASEAAPKLLDSAGPLFGGGLGQLILIVSSVMALGSILLGAAIIRAGVLPRWAGVLLIAGAPLAAFWPPLPQIAGTIGIILFGLGYAWLGYALVMQKKGETVALPLQPRLTQ